MTHTFSPMANTTIGNPVNLVAQLNPDFETNMTLVGWASDGF